MAAAEAEAKARMHAEEAAADARAMVAETESMLAFMRAEFDEKLMLLKAEFDERCRVAAEEVEVRLPLQSMSAVDAAVRQIAAPAVAERQPRVVAPPQVVEPPRAAARSESPGRKALEAKEFGEKIAALTAEVSARWQVAEDAMAEAAAAKRAAQAEIVTKPLPPPMQPAPLLTPAASLAKLPALAVEERVAQELARRLQKFDIDPAEAATLARGGRIETLQLWCKGIGGDGARALAVALSQGSSRIDNLDLLGNSVGNNGAKAFAAALQAGAQVETLCLASNNISCEGAVALAAALSSGAPTRSLDLRNNSIGDSGAKALAAAVEAGAQLEELGLGGNEIGQEGASALAAALGQEHTALRQLKLYCNADAGTLATYLTK
eukprot:NODE_839_length_1347_cov_200.465170.p1 GENE.NODE_839_length_1347_cov_200.465170~~NODE_839_length_1347_cov_200.465170.p1  ORF type:complete len:404 (-),score=170.67 NODE_839_length_1347_cov_200.465170:117-1256(-)